MMPDLHLTPHRDEAGLFGRSSEIYKGGPAEGALQRMHPAARVAGAVVLLLGVGLADNAVALMAVFAVAIAVAVLSFLDMASLYKVMLVPVLLISLPVWLVAGVLQSSAEAGALLFIRTLTSVSIAAVAMHSVGLRNIAAVLDYFRVPVELRQMWSIMVAQVFSFFGLLQSMRLARRARHVQKVSGGRVRQEVGRQAGVLFGRTWKRGNELAYALESRTIERKVPRVSFAKKMGWPDVAFLAVSVALAGGLWLA